MSRRAMRDLKWPLTLQSRCPIQQGVTSGFASVQRRCFKIAIYAALVVLFLWPALYNGQPFFYPDTSAYIRGFDAGIVKHMVHPFFGSGERISISFNASVQFQQQTT